MFSKENRKERKIQKVGKKKITYTAAGKSAARKEAAKTGKKMTKTKKSRY